MVAAAYIVVSINRLAVCGEGLIKLLLYHVDILQVILLQGHTGTTMKGFADVRKKQNYGCMLVVNVPSAISPSV